MNTTQTIGQTKPKVNPKGTCKSYTAQPNCFQKMTPPMMVMYQQHEESKESGERTLCAGGAQRRLV